MILRMLSWPYDASYAFMILRVYVCVWTWMCVCVHVRAHSQGVIQTSWQTSCRHFIPLLSQAFLQLYLYSCYLQAHTSMALLSFFTASVIWNSARQQLKCNVFFHLMLADMTPISLYLILWISIILWMILETSRYNSPKNANLLCLNQLHQNNLLTEWILWVCSEWVPSEWESKH